jgi:hypothetical protein
MGPERAADGLCLEGRSSRSASPEFSAHSNQSRRKWEDGRRAIKQSGPRLLRAELSVKNSPFSAPKMGRFLLAYPFKNCFQINILARMTLRCTRVIFRVTQTHLADSFSASLEG